LHETTIRTENEIRGAPSAGGRLFIFADTNAQRRTRSPAPAAQNETCRQATEAIIRSRAKYPEL
jgi:hypothetical protein